MFEQAPNSYGVGMETMKSLTPQLTLVAPSTQEPASLAARCAGVTVRALTACAHAYVGAAQYNMYWIGWPGAFQKKDQA